MLTVFSLINSIWFAGADDERLSLEQLSKRNRLESEVRALREQQSEMNESEYFTQLETLLVEIAEMYVDDRSRLPVIASRP